MKFVSPLIRGRLIKRYKRFLADVVLDETGETVTASCANTGSMKGLLEPDIPVWLSETSSTTRKYRHTWELVENSICGTPELVGINTGHPNKVIAEAIADNKIAPLKGYASLKREQKYGKSSRIDILLEDEKKGRAYVEIKNVHMMREKGIAEFPDSVTARGAKHLEELADMVSEGHRAVMVYLVQRGDATRFDLAPDIDPHYAETFAKAMQQGVEAIAYRCKITATEIQVDKKIPVVAIKA